MWKNTEESKLKNILGVYQTPKRLRLSLLILIGCFWITTSVRDKHKNNAEDHDKITEEISSESLSETPHTLRVMEENDNKPSTSKKGKGITKLFGGMRKRKGQKASTLQTEHKESEFPTEVLPRYSKRGNNQIEEFLCWFCDEQIALSEQLQINIKNTKNVPEDLKQAISVLYGQQWYLIKVFSDMGNIKQVLEEGQNIQEYSSSFVIVHLIKLKADELGAEKLNKKGNKPKSEKKRDNANKLREKLEDCMKELIKSNGLFLKANDHNVEQVELDPKNAQLANFLSELMPTVEQNQIQRFLKPNPEEDLWKNARMLFEYEEKLIDEIRKEMENEEKGIAQTPFKKPKRSLIKKLVKSKFYGFDSESFTLALKELNLYPLSNNLLEKEDINRIVEEIIGGLKFEFEFLRRKLYECAELETTTSTKLVAITVRQKEDKISKTSKIAQCLYRLETSCFSLRKVLTFLKESLEECRKLMAAAMKYYPPMPEFSQVTFPQHYPEKYSRLFSSILKNANHIKEMNDKTQGKISDYSAEELIHQRKAIGSLNYNIGEILSECIRLLEKCEKEEKRAAKASLNYPYQCKKH